jgi:heat shock protein HtpX
MTWIRDWGLTIRMLLTMFLLAVIYLGFITLLYVIGFPVTIIMAVAGILLFLQFYFSDRIVLMSMGARIVEEHEAPELYEIVRRLCIRANIPMPRIAIVNTPIPNAFATGRSPNNAVVAVTTGLLSLLNRDELEAVIGHELSHIKNRDVMVLTIGNFLATIAWFVMEHVMWWELLGDSEERNPLIGLALFAVSAIVWLISTLLILALSRYREFAADAGSAILTGKPHALISALAKISGRMELIDPGYKKQLEGLNAFFILPAISGKTIMSLFSTHPPVEKRVERLKKIAQELGVW